MLEMKEQSYWDKVSTLAAIVSDHESIYLYEDFFEAINSIDGLSLVGIDPPSSENPYGRVDFDYYGEKNYFFYMLAQYSTDFSYLQNQVLSEED